MGKMKAMWEDEYRIEEAQDEALYESLSTFLNSGGTDLGYENGNYPDPDDWDDVLINEIKVDVYWKLKHHTLEEDDIA